MHIRCTKKLLVELKDEPESVAEDNPRNIPGRRDIGQGD